MNWSFTGNVLALFACVTLAGGCGGDGDNGDDPNLPTFTRYVVDSGTFGPAFVTVTDFDQDGKKELLVSYYGDTEITVPPGRLIIHRFGDSLAEWSVMEEVVTEQDGISFPNETTVDDVDGDGDLDIILPTGFFRCALEDVNCGNLIWLEQTESGWVRHDVVSESPDFYHIGVLVDFDDDGVRDLVTVGEQYRSANAMWFRGIDGGDLFETEPLIMGEGLGSFPVVLDIDGDDDLDVASAEYFYPQAASFAWFERTENPGIDNPTGSFVRHVIDEESGPALQMKFVADFLGDGVMRAIGTNHCNTTISDVPAAAYLFEVPQGDAVRSPWPKTQIIEGIATDDVAYHQAPGHFATGDIDGDGDIDILLAGDGDPRIFWLEQQEGGKLVEHVLEKDMGHAGGTHVVDLDGDGVNELITTGYYDNSVFVYVRD